MISPQPCKALINYSRPCLVHLSARRDETLSFSLGVLAAAATLRTISSIGVAQMTQRRQLSHICPCVISSHTHTHTSSSSRPRATWASTHGRKIRLTALFLSWESRVFCLFFEFRKPVKTEKKSLRIDCAAAKITTTAFVVTIRNAENGCCLKSVPVDCQPALLDGEHKHEFSSLRWPHCCCCCWDTEDSAQLESPQKAALIKRSLYL